MSKPRILGPVEGHGHSGVTDVVSYRSVHRLAMQKAEKNVFEIDEPREAYINHGRWVVDCDCNGAGLTSTTFKLTCCFDCGRVYTSVTFPKDAEKIEDALLKRREQAQRNWKGETLKAILSENKEQSDGVD
jgi:hypothetical protein